MKLRKLELSKDIWARYGINLHGSELSLWFDAVQEKDQNALDHFFCAYYPLHENPLHKKTKISREKNEPLYAEYAQGSLYYLGGDGNLFLQYREITNATTEERMAMPDIENSVFSLRPERLLEPDAGLSPAAYADRVKRYLDIRSASAAKSCYKEALRMHLQDVQSVLMTVMEDPHIAMRNPENHDIPKEYADKFQPPLMKLKFAAFPKDFLERLTGLLTAHDLTYETPRHKEILQTIVLGDLREYHGHALAEFHERTIINS